MDTSVDASDQLQPAAAFARKLRRARRQHGDLPYRELAARTRFVSASTLHRAMQGTKLPTWPVVEHLLVGGFGLAADTVREEWLPLWVAAKDAMDPIDEPGESSSGSSEAGDDKLAVETPTACPECGLPVAAVAIHARFHEQHTLAGAPAGSSTTKRRRLRLA